ncbi:hypothetical protein BJ944DRAFT_236493 [Cunninghamella echinulata]|nr:hypothetical protein BJ944DRAFT_236493 [Cunninghamella echinulata]
MVILSDLPLEIFQTITLYLHKKDIYSLCLVNRAYYHYCYPSLFHSVNITNEHQLNSFEHALRNKHWGRKVLGSNTKELEFKGTIMTLENLKFIQAQCGNVKHLTMDRETWLHIYETQMRYGTNIFDQTILYDMMKTFFKNYSQLTTLSLDLLLGPSNDSQLNTFLQHLPHLQDLSLGQINLLEIDDLELIHSCCPQLSSLTVEGFCLLRKIPVAPILSNNLLKKLTIRFSSGWSVYWGWLHYIGVKYTNLDTLICICPTVMGVRNINNEDSNIVLCCNTFAKQHARTLKRLEITNLNLDIYFYRALNSHLHFSSQVSENNDNNYINNNNTIIELNKNIPSSPLLSSLPVIKELRINKSSTEDSMPKFKCIINYIHTSIEILEIFAPTMYNHEFHIYNDFSRCIHLFDLTLHIPFQSRFFIDFDIDILLKNCPRLNRLCIMHSTLRPLLSSSSFSAAAAVLATSSPSSSSPSSLSSSTSTSTFTETKKDHPLKELVLKHLHITEQTLSSSFSHSFHLCNLQILKIARCVVIYPYDQFDVNSSPLNLDFNLLPIYYGNMASPLSLYLNNLDFCDNEDTNATQLGEIAINESKLDRIQSWRLDFRKTKWKKGTLVYPRRSERLKEKDNSKSPYLPNTARLTINCQSMKQLFINEQQLI